MTDSQLNRPLGELVQPLQTVLSASDTIAEALTFLRQKNIDHKAIYFYVTDSENRLIGVVPTRKLLLSNPNALIESIMETPVVRLHANQTLQDAMEVFAKRGLIALPVVDGDNKPLGVIDIETYLEESFDIADAQHRRDMFQFAGLTLEDRRRVSPFRDYRFRMPWITCNLLSGIICAVISRFYETVLDEIVLLAMFIPLVLTLSESVSMQSMTHSLQFLRHPRVTWLCLLRRMLWEEKVILFVSATCGGLVGVISLLWKGGYIVSMAIGFSIFLSVIAAATFGFVFPVLVNKSRLDPKVAAGPVVLMLADIVTTAIYLSLATLWLL